MSLYKSGKLAAQLIAALCACLVLAACAQFYRKESVESLQSERVAETDDNSVTIDYQARIQPVLEKRCILCHGCYDAPCQLKLEAADGLLRGATDIRVYDGGRLTEIDPTRLFEDAHTRAQWRKAGFHPVLNETSGDQLQSLLANMLQLKNDNPLPQQSILPGSFDFSLYRDQECTSAEKFDEFKTAHPLWGMPYGLPQLPDREYRVLRDWLTVGAPTGQAPPLSKSLRESVERWEEWLNRNDLKHRLTARYLYEHLFLANLFFRDEGRNTRYFRIVRSSTPPGEPVIQISTRRPFDDPRVKRVYYRLRADNSSIVEKSHLPYLLDDQRLRHWQSWFIDARYKVSRLPDYKPEHASNPFISFRELPSNSRYRFLLDEAEFTIMNFIKGSVCRGAIALNVIPDQFWVFFVKPGIFESSASDRFLARQDKHLRLPAAEESGVFSIAHWQRYSEAHKKYLTAKWQFIRDHKQKISDSGLDLLWDGEGKNHNATLTIFRHFDSATVIKGFNGPEPETAWLVDYTILERIHYLLVAGFDVFGSVSHQAMTRMYMDFLRMESEMNFLTLLPREDRKAQLSRWYRGAGDDIDNYFRVFLDADEVTPPLAYTTRQHKPELYGKLNALFAPVMETRYRLENSGLPASAVKALHKLELLHGQPASILPQSALINVRDHGILTLLSNKAYSNISSMFREQDRRIPDEDSLVVLNGVVGAYPNVILDLSSNDIADLVSKIESLRNEDDYRRLLDTYGVRRSDPRIWEVSDELHNKYYAMEPLTSGILDFNRLENR